MQHNNISSLARVKDEISYENFMLSLRLKYDHGYVVNTINVLRLIECNPHIKQLEIDEMDDLDEYTTDMQLLHRIFRYLGQRCYHVMDVRLAHASAEQIRLALVSFPNLTKLSFSEMHDLHLMQPIEEETASYPNMQAFHFNTNTLRDFEVIARLLKSFSNLTELHARGSVPWIFQDRKKP